MLFFLDYCNTYRLINIKWTTLIKKQLVDLAKKSNVKGGHQLLTSCTLFQTAFLIGYDSQVYLYIYRHTHICFNFLFENMLWLCSSHLCVLHVINYRSSILFSINVCVPVIISITIRCGILYIYHLFRWLFLQ